MRNDPVVVGVDGSPGARRAVSWGADEAAERHLPLLLVHGFGVPDSFPGEGTPPPEWLADRERRSRDWLAEAVGIAERAHPGLEVSAGSFSDPPIPLLIKQSGSARMIVVGSAGRSALGDVAMGSTAISLAAHGHCPVAVVRGRDREREPVVVGVDGSPLSGAAIALAFEEASLRGAELITFRAYGGWERILESDQPEVAPWREKYPAVKVQQVTARGDPRRQLLGWSERAQLIVVGNRGCGGFTGLLLGSTSHAMIHHADCPVLVARSGPGN